VSVGGNLLFLFPFFLLHFSFVKFTTFFLSVVVSLKKGLQYFFAGLRWLSVSFCFRLLGFLEFRAFDNQVLQCALASHLTTALTDVRVVVALLLFLRIENSLLLLNHTHDCVVVEHFLYGNFFVLRLYRHVLLRLLHFCKPRQTVTVGQVCRVVCNKRWLKLGAFLDLICYHFAPFLVALSFVLLTFAEQPLFHRTCWLKLWLLVNFWDSNRSLLAHVVENVLLAEVTVNLVVVPSNWSFVALGQV
jgi:hypothetical protein